MFTWNKISTSNKDQLLESDQARKTIWKDLKYLDLNNKKASFSVSYRLNPVTSQAVDSFAVSSGA